MYKRVFFDMVKDLVDFMNRNEIEKENIVAIDLDRLILIYWIPEGRGIM